MSYYNGQENNSFSVNTKANNGVKWLIKIIVFIVYTAGALFATIAFQNEVDGLFKDAAPILALLATIGAWSNFASVVTMLWAKDYWIHGTGMMAVAVIGWVLEVTMMAANTLAAYGSTWTTGWVQLTPATPVFVIFLWGLLWILHPDHKQRQTLMNFETRRQQSWMEKLSRAMETPEVQNILNEAATKAARGHAEQAFNVRINGTYTDDLDKSGQHSSTEKKHQRPIIYNAPRHSHSFTQDVPVQPDPTKQQPNGRSK